MNISTSVRDGEFSLKSALAYPLALPIMPLLRAWLKQSLQSIRTELSR